MRPAAALLALASTLALVVAVAPTAGRPARAASLDPVIAWNGHAAAALFNSTSAAIPGAGYTPPPGSILMAMVQLAVFDAVNAIEGGYEPYITGLASAPASASVEAAVATAAHDVLVGLQPQLPSAVSTRLDGLLATTLAGIPAGAGKAAGIAAGAGAAAAILADRANDGRWGPYRFPLGSGPGAWVPTSGVNDPFAWVAEVRPFTMRSTDQFRTAGPATLNSARYAAEFAEVRSIGAAASTTRSADQTALALYYTENPFTLYNRTFRLLAEREALSAIDAARLFALLNASGADAIIACWVDKARWSFWRPITAIREAATDGNRATAADPAWTSLVASPPYPDHPSGYNCVTGAFMRAAREAFGGDATSFDVVNAAGVRRSYERFSDVSVDTIEGRILLGIHFRAADEQGAWLGEKVAGWVAPRFLTPVNGRRVGQGGG
ncbi:MAG TPA: vanadium-dependent haloperoxidase [Candidatus Limnocylindrales bacterium]|nr:vanadium-dependent haloperoxidase [Candidatus Limnocylindrales bacterium]